MYIIETKFNQSAEKALEQIVEREYWKPFIACNKPIILVGLSFARKPGKFDITYVMKKL